MTSGVDRDRSSFTLGAFGAEYVFRRTAGGAAIDDDQRTVMGQLSTRDAERALLTIEAICGDALNAAAFARRGVSELARLVGSELTTLSICDLRSGHRSVVSDVPHAITRSDLDCFDRYFFAHPLVRYHAAHRDGGARTISDSLPDRVFHGTGLYNEYYRRIGIDRAMALPLLVDSSLLVSFVLNRRGRDFSERDRAVLDAVRRTLSASYRNALVLERARLSLTELRECATEAGWLSFSVDARGCFGHLSSAVAALLQGCWPGLIVRHGASVPSELGEWLRRRSSPSLSDVRNERFTANSEGREVIFHAVPNVEHERETFIVARMPSRMVAPALSPSLPLTPRERDVLSWLSVGKTNAQIAAILSLSPRTVQKHLEHIYVKLGVETRTAAVARGLATH